MKPTVILLSVCVLLSFATFVAYWWDKRKAVSGAWRTPESTLHLLSLAGGWPGAWVAQRVVRHKNAKPAFMRIYWLTVVLNCMAAGWLLFSSTGHAIFHGLGA